MKLTKYLAGTAICVLSLQFYFQTQAQQLEIGDPVPDLLLEQVVNYPGGSAHFSDFDGKLIIIDFWETWCVPCVRGLPHMQQLQQEFDGQLQVCLSVPRRRPQSMPFFRKRTFRFLQLLKGDTSSNCSRISLCPTRFGSKIGRCLPLPPTRQ